MPPTSLETSLLFHIADTYQYLSNCKSQNQTGTFVFYLLDLIKFRFWNGSGSVSTTGGRQERVHSCRSKCLITSGFSSHHVLFLSLFMKILISIIETTHMSSRNVPIISTVIADHIRTQRSQSRALSASGFLIRGRVICNQSLNIPGEKANPRGLFLPEREKLFSKLVQYIDFFPFPKKCQRQNKCLSFHLCGMAIRTLDKNNINKRRQLLPVQLPKARRGKLNSGIVLKRTLPPGDPCIEISRNLRTATSRDVETCLVFF